MIDEKNKPKILVVDDNPTDLKFLTTLISYFGYDFETATNGIEAIEKARTTNPDLILLDVLMPEMNGIEACKILKEDPETQHIPIIVLTVFVDKEMKIECLKAGANDFLSKPVDNTELIARIKNFLQLKYLEDIKIRNELMTETIKAIENAKRDWEQTMDCINDIVIITDAKDNIIRCNKMLTTLTGKPYSELLNCKWQNFVREIGFSYKISNSGNIEMYHPSGRCFNYKIYYTKKITNDTIVPVAIITLQDITERKKREEEILLLQELSREINESENFNTALQVVLQKICEATGWVFGEAWTPSHDSAYLQCIMTWYRDEGIRKFAEASKKFTFESGVGLPGQVWSLKRSLWIKDITVDPNFSRAQFALSAGLKSAVAIPVMSNSNVAIVLGFFTFDIKDEDEELVGLISVVAAQLGSAIYKKLADDELKKSREILKQKNMELERAYAELKTAQSQIIQSEKMASIGQLAAGIAHEINNPVGFIMSNLTSLLKYSDKLSRFIQIQTEAIEKLSAQGEDINKILDTIKETKKSLKVDYITDDINNLIKESLDGTERVKNIVQDLKSFSRVDEAEWKMADINAGIESTINIVWNELKYKATVKKEYGDIPVTKCNPGQMNQVFMNILVNAAHAIEKQGEITVKTWHDNGYIHVSISDTGCGIPADKINRIFEPFFTTKDVGKGTGLGLSIAYDIVKKHDGAIIVESEVGKGTTFTVKIPVVEK